MGANPDKIEDDIDEDIEEDIPMIEDDYDNSGAFEMSSPAKQAP